MTRADKTLGAMLMDPGIKEKSLKTPAGRIVRKDIKIGTLRKRAK